MTLDGRVGTGGTFVLMLVRLSIFGRQKVTLRGRPRLFGKLERARIVCGPLFALSRAPPKTSDGTPCTRGGRGWISTGGDPTPDEPIDRSFEGTLALGVGEPDFRD